jgi:hypothetical protein
MNATTNGRTRKTLSEQIDKLSSILDGLSENLNDAVADAVRDATHAAVQEAVQRALMEVLTNPDVLVLLGGLVPSRPSSPLQATPTAGVGEDRSRLRDRLGGARDWAGRLARAAGAACARGFTGLKAGLLALWSLRTRLLAAVSVGAAAGLAAYLLGPWLSTLAGAAIGCAANLVVSARLWLGQLWARLVSSGA